MITVKELFGQKELKQFVCFPFQLYKNDPFWVPTLISDELQHFDPAKNPVFLEAEARFFMAFQNGKPVGRVAAMINWPEVKNQGIPKIRFGWWDVIDDVAVTRALIEKVRAWGAEKGLTYMEGPMGFSNLDKVGVITEGYDFEGSMITWYNKPYYVTHLEALGFEVEKRYRESSFELSDIKQETFQRGQALIRQRFKVKALSFKSTSEILPYVDEMFDLFNESYAVLPSFVPVTAALKNYFKEKYIPLINPELIKFVFDEQDKMIAFGIVMPSFTEALQRSGGKLWPFGWIHFWKAKKSIDEVLLYLIGIAPAYQNKGITAVIFDEYYKTMLKLGVKRFVRTPELEENIAIENVWRHFNPNIKRRRCTYRRSLLPF
ncbi:MAG: GTP cyclohydrolase [Flavobacterium sp. BFFFF2]|nr:MAG: GTP cyclohydrolase [Flavobacterium sp. BFFFF2]